MATPGVDCHVVLDGQGYLLAPRSFQMHRPRLRKSTLTLTGAERWVDLGPGKRVWQFTVLALGDLMVAAGTPLGMSPTQIRAALEASYGRVGATLPFVDPTGAAFTVRFDGLVEVARDARAQAADPGYLLAVELVEA